MKYVLQLLDLQKKYYGSIIDKAQGWTIENRQDTIGEFKEKYRQLEKAEEIIRAHDDFEKMCKEGDKN